MAVLFYEETKAAIESLLFVASEPVSLKTLSQVLEITEEDARQLLEELGQEYDKGKRGIRIREVAHGYQMCTPPEYASYIERLYRPQSNYGLSKAALETLAIIAYKQPVTRGEMELIRGVKVDGPVKTLLEKGLIREVGRKEGAGRPVLYGTTEDFLKYFGIKDLKDLPDPEEFIINNEEDQLNLAEEG